MKSVKSEFPNPVLATGRDDYIESCRFYTAFEDTDITVDAENILIPIKYVLECNGLSGMIKSGDAVAAVIVKKGIIELIIAYFSFFYCVVYTVLTKRMEKGSEEC